MSDLSLLALRLACEATRRAPRALATVSAWRHVRTQLEGAGEGARTAAREGVLVTLRVEGARGVGSAEEWIGASELAAPRTALVRAAVAQAHRARDEGSLEGALWGLGTGSERTVKEPDPLEVFLALRAGAGKGAVSADISLETTRTAQASAGREGVCRHARTRTGLAVQGEVAWRGTTSQLGLACEVDGDRKALLREARAAGREARARAVSRVKTVELGTPRFVLLSPGFVTWILHGTLVPGFACAQKGARASLASWLEVDDGGGELADEQGIVPAPVALARNGVWQRGPFLPFDGSGRTRRDGRTGIPRASLATLVVRANSERARPLRTLEVETDTYMGEVASADPLPGGRVHLIGHAARLGRGRSRAAGLASMRLSVGELLRRTVAVSREVEPVTAQELVVHAPWILVRGVRVSSLRSAP